MVVVRCLHCAFFFISCLVCVVCCALLVVCWLFFVGLHVLFGVWYSQCGVCNALIVA